MNERMLLILAAGEGKRMKSNTPKVLHRACGKHLISWVIDVACDCGMDETTIVIGHQGAMVRAALGESFRYAVQEKQLGTGHAVMMARESLVGKSGDVLILCGDAPLITTQTLKEALALHSQKRNVATVITAKVPDPTGYGRIERDENGNVLKIVECKDATREQKKINEINSGMYCFRIEQLLEALDELTNRNAQQEYYLTDTLEILIQKGHLVGAYLIDNSEEILGINDREQLACASGILRSRILKNHMKNGVTIVDPASTLIDATVTIEMDTTIQPFTILEGNTRIASNCLIGPSTRLVDCEVGINTEITQSVALQSSIGEDTHVGPFAYIRPGSKIGNHVKIGDFVEVKKSTIGDNTKVSHLTYIGDATIGKNVNLGCGVVVVNYDGVNKNLTQVEDNAFVGCNVNLIAPVVIENGAYVAAGSTITDKVPADALAIARVRQTVKENWVKNKLKKKIEK